MKAVMIKDDYIDLAPGYEYEIVHIYSDGHIKLKGSPRKYDIKSFNITRNGKSVSHKEAYRLYRLECVFDGRKV